MCDCAPQCKSHVVEAQHLLTDSPTLLSLSLYVSTDGESPCYLGNQTHPPLAKWSHSAHGPVPFFLCNAIVMPSYAGLPRTILVASATLVALFVGTLCLREVVTDLVDRVWLKDPAKKRS
jgi:hypothetical protein